MGYSYQDKTPGKLANELLELTAQYSDLSDELAVLLEAKDLSWGMLRDITTSDKQADHLWERTKEGQRERRIKLEMKKIQVTMRSIKNYLAVKSDEARNLY